MYDLDGLVKLFKNDEGDPLQLSEGQKKIINIILQKKPKRNFVMTATQYGKSMTCSIGVDICAAVIPKEKWCIVGATESKSRIIMNYAISHLFDNALFYSQLKMDTSLERLKAEKSKERMTFRRGGEIFVLSAQAKNKRATMDSLTGFGAKNIILDDSVLIDNDFYAMVKRMLGGHKDSFLLETGNPFKRNHFYKTSIDSKYNKIIVDYRQAIAEGRYSEEFIEEMRKELFFDMLYECKFPDSDSIDDAGWSNLLSDADFENYMRGVKPESGFNKPDLRLGVDIGRGINWSTFIMRYKKTAWIESKMKSKDLMTVVGTVIEILNKYKINACQAYVDDIGVGSGVTDRLREQNYYINAVKDSERADDGQKYINRRAECFFRVKEWFEREGGQLVKDNNFYQLLNLKYKVDSSGRLKIMSKDEMRKNGIESPDFADGLALTFALPDIKSLKMAEGMQSTRTSEDFQLDEIGKSMRDF